MRIAAQITAGNSAEVIEGCISHHRALGVDSFVVLHVHSEDDTLHRLRRIEAAAADVTVIAAQPEEVASGLIPPALYDELHARSAAADWILRIDADERWYANGSGLAGVLRCLQSGSVVVPRFNAVWPDPERATAAGQMEWLPLDDLPLALHPVAMDSTLSARLDTLPWVLTRIGPKSAIGAGKGLDFSLGGHVAVQRGSGARSADAATTTDLLIAQLAFGSLARFERKLRALAWFDEGLRRSGMALPPGAAWHWRRLVDIQHRGADAVAAEWRRQFLTPAQAQALAGHGVIVNGADAFDVLAAEA